MAKGARKKDFTHPTNENRQRAKYQRNRGQKAMKKAGLSSSEWAQKFDPLLYVKGQRRHDIVTNNN
jgi:hypothetical protein